jgi:hypothetical protein
LVATLNPYAVHHCNAVLDLVGYEGSFGWRKVELANNSTYGIVYVVSLHIPSQILTGPSPANSERLWPRRRYFRHATERILCVGVPLEALDYKLIVH